MVLHSRLGNNGKKENPQCKYLYTGIVCQEFSQKSHTTTTRRSHTDKFEHLHKDESKHTQLQLRVAKKTTVSGMSC